MTLFFLYNQFLPWSSLALSLFNVVLLLWLGLTVLLNASQRSWGTWLAGLGLLLGGLFFLVHAATIDLSTDVLMERAQYWWALAIVPILCLPFAWLLLMQWYCGFWDTGDVLFRGRAKVTLQVAAALFLLLAVLCVAVAPRLGHSPFGGPTLVNSVPYLGFRILLWYYPLFLLLCTGASLDALSHPAPANRFMGEEARRRARPWLQASSLVQFFAGVGIAALSLDAGYLSLHSSLIDVSGQLASALDWIDVISSLFIAVAVILLGKAVVSFEIFTGKILPRGGFWRQWRAIVILATVYALLLSLALAFDSLPPIFPPLLTTFLMSVFLALSSHAAYGERERAVVDLRPFVASQHLYDGLLSGDSQRLEGVMDEPFHALCEGILNTSKACLIARGPLAPLAGAPRLYPPQEPFLAEWKVYADSATLDGFPCRALPPDSGMDWLVPLRGRGQLLGALLLGQKKDSGLYTLEEIEVARAAGEHLLDAQAGATLAGRLMEVQRQKLAEVQVLDRRARRVLHDDILPQLHACLLALSAAGAPSEAMATLSAAHSGISDLLRELPIGVSPVAARSLWDALQREVEVEMQGAFDQVEWLAEPEAELALAALAPLTADTLFYAAREALRNAAKYGRQGDDADLQLVLKVKARRLQGLVIEISDNGSGLAADSVSSGGSGRGLVLHGTLLAVVGGQLALEAPPEGGVKVVLSLPSEAYAGAESHGGAATLRAP